MLRRFRLLYLALLALTPAVFAQTTGNPIARFHTDLGDIDVTLLQNIAPKNVANFIHYVNRAQGAYNNSFIHRSVAGFVVQGGGFKLVSGEFKPIPTDSPVVNEFHVSNTRGTIAMAKTPNNPNSATDQWFFNLADNGGDPNDLDTQNGGFTVFGQVRDSAGLAVMDAIAAVPVYNATSVNSAFDSLPLQNYTSGTIQDANLVHVIWVKQVPQINAVTKTSTTTAHIQGTGSASLTYQVQRSASPASSGFTTLASVTADSSGNISYNDTSAGTGKFYRLAIP